MVGGWRETGWGRDRDGVTWREREREALVEGEIEREIERVKEIE